jgi:hypothetical protein
VPELKVAARTSVFAFKGKEADVREIGQKLGVAHLVEGSIRRDGGQVRVTAQLVRVSDGFHVWSESYDRELKSVFALQDELARQIGTQLRSRLGLGRDAGRARRDRPVAYDEYLKGRALYRVRTTCRRRCGIWRARSSWRPDSPRAGPRSRSRTRWCTGSQTTPSAPRSATVMRR